jgi:hypothetical protein
LRGLIVEERVVVVVETNVVEGLNVDTEMTTDLREKIGP